VKKIKTGLDKIKADGGDGVGKGGPRCKELFLEMVDRLCSQMGFDDLCTAAQDYLKNTLNCEDPTADGKVACTYGENSTPAPTSYFGSYFGFHTQATTDVTTALLDTATTNPDASSGFAVESDSSSTPGTSSASGTSASFLVLAVVAVAGAIARVL